MSKITLQDWEIEEDRLNDVLIMTNKATGQSFEIQDDGSISMNGNIDFADNQAVNLVLEQVAGDPASPVTGQIWYDTTQD